MGRKSKLTELQWIEAAKRVLDGEPKRSVARSFGISESALREKISAQVEEIKDVANQIVSVEQRLEKLPIAAQIKLTEGQWVEIEKRLLQGEKAASLAREYGVGRTSISMRLSKRFETVKNVAGQIVETEKALSLLNINEQNLAFSLASDLLRKKHGLSHHLL